LAVKDKTGGAQQPWFSTSPIKGAFYFAPGTLTPNASPSAAPVAVLPPAPAAKRPQTTEPANLTPSPLQPSNRPPTMEECAEKYKAARDAGSLGGQKWNDFRYTQCKLSSGPVFNGLSAGRVEAGCFWRA
jgi:hypothetical protein